MTEQKNSTLSSLNSALHDQLKRLNNDELKGDALKEEIERSSAMTGIAKEIVGTARTVLEATKLRAEYKGLQASDNQRLEDLS